MKESSFSVDLASMDSIFNNKTLKYRINGFAYACKMDGIEVVKINAIKGPDVVELNSGVFFGKQENKRTCEGNNYFVAINKNKKGLFGKNVTISGYYGDLNFSFTNYYENKNIAKKVIEIPFKIALATVIDKDNYKMDIETMRDKETKITFSKYREHKKRTISYQHAFYTNIFDFSNVLKLIKAFVYNPELVFKTYNEVIAQKKMVFTGSDLSKALMQDTNLDKPLGKVKRIIKTIIE